MTQCERILQYMQEVGPITKRMVTDKNRYGEAVSFAEYRLEEKRC